MEKMKGDKNGLFLEVNDGEAYVERKPSRLKRIGNALMRAMENYPPYGYGSARAGIMPYIPQHRPELETETENTGEN